MTNPKLRFDGFHDDWNGSTIDQIANFRRGSFPQPYGLRKWYDDENGFPFIQVFDVGKNFRLKKTTKRLISESAKKLSVLVPKGSIVLTIQGSIGRIAITQYDACCDRTLLIITDFKIPIVKVYFVYALYLRFQLEERIAVGGTIKTITKEKLKIFPIALPTIPEQQKIADFLTAVDSRIGQLSQKKALLEAYKKGVMQQLFSQAIRFKDDDGSQYPDWEVKQIGELGRVVTGGTPPTNKRDLYGDDYLFVSPADISDSRTILESKKKLTLAGHSRGSLVPAHSTLFVCIGSTIGKVGQVFSECTTNQQINAIIPNESNNSDFVYSLLEYHAPRIRMLSASQAVPIINKSIFSSYDLDLPMLSEQTKIANLLSAIDSKIENVSKQIEETKTFKKGLLQQMFV